MLNFNSKIVHIFTGTYTPPFFLQRTKLFMKREINPIQLYYYMFKKPNGRFTSLVFCVWILISQWSLFNFKISNFSAISRYIRWNGDDDCFVLDLHADLDFYSASSLKYNNPRVDVSLQSDTLFQFRPMNQWLLLFLNDACLMEKQQIPVL